jgi:hypothetical protein
VKSFSSITPGARRLSAVLSGIALIIGAAVIVPAASAASPPGNTSTHARWVASWAASPMPGTTPTGTTSFTNQTIRNIVYTSAGGGAFRVRLTNTFGTQPLSVGGVSAGIVLDGAQLVPGTTRTVTFGGKTGTAVAPGAELLSDPVSMRIQPLTELAISVFLPASTGPATNHQDAQQANYIASGDHAGNTAATAYTKTTGSARGLETTGDNRHHSDNKDMRTGGPTMQWNGPPSGSPIGITAGQRYRTSSPVTARPMIIRCISDVPSKIVKIFASWCQQGFSTCPRG